MTQERNRITDFYQQRINQFSNEGQHIQDRIRRTSLWRVAVFVFTAVGIYLGAVYDSWVALSAMLGTGITVFILLILRHVRLYREKQRNGQLLKINQTELELMDGNTGSKDEGQLFLEPDHPFAGDLDVFGKRSLFQLIDRCVTHMGLNRLSKTLKDPLSRKDSLQSRQQAIEELKNLPEWRQEFQALGQDEMRDKLSLTKLLQWADSSNTSFHNLLNYIMLVVNPLVGLSVTGLILAGVLSNSWFWIFLLLPTINLMPKLSVINKEHALLGKQTELLETYATLFEKIQEQKFHSDLLVSVRSALAGAEASANQAFRKLASISKAFDYRLNFLVGILLDVFFLWDILQVMRLEQWKKEYGSELSAWFAELARLDELNAWAGFAFNFPDAHFPQQSEQGFILEGENLRHPFISEDSCVGNPASLKGWGQFQVITGANMAGKSTYLRTVGVNLLLAMAGAPVLADSLTFTPVQLFTGIKTSDSLQDGASYFFAELKRLKEIIECLEEGIPLFIILDEILRGTNSKDKQKGSRALLKQLIHRQASGLMATHDLSLGELAEVFPDHIVNKRFEVEITGEEMVFDYTLKEGISQNLNASFLMKKMGIADTED
ncbi:MAG: hypothetical protein JXR71_10875 [Bacteroidales bacterium]|nr:hypothetical protein [Bacteroidales bacterium]